MLPSSFPSTGVAHLLAWGALAALLYAYFAYPAILYVLAKLRPFVPTARESERAAVTVLIAAWNEEDVIAEKIENTLSQDYPADRLDLIVVSDGSTDRTDEIVAAHAAQTGRVRLVRVESRQGKSLALNAGVDAASSDVLVMTDANATFEPDAVRRLVSALSDSAVGAVSGQLRYRPGEGTEATEGAYWRYESLVKGWESALGSLLGANGSIYALRSSLYRPVGPRDVNDFRIPYEVLLAGRAVVLEPRAVSRETAAPDLWSEYGRKVRIMSRAIPTMLSLVWPTLKRGRAVLLWQLISHKVLREIQGLFFAAALAGAIWGALLGDAVLTVLLAGHLALYGLGALGWGVPALSRLRPARLAAHFDMIILASVSALLRWATGRVEATWTPTRPSGRDT
jgi:cellulose synthase/poly-beta-1,6-N-acetylglucosamine synthase-like glycosyltransferase